MDETNHCQKAGVKASIREATTSASWNSHTGRGQWFAAAAGGKFCVRFESMEIFNIWFLWKNWKAGWKSLIEEDVG